MKRIIGAPRRSTTVKHHDAHGNNFMCPGGPLLDQLVSAACDALPRAGFRYGSFAADPELLAADRSARFEPCGTSEERSSRHDLFRSVWTDTLTPCRAASAPRRRT